MRTPIGSKFSALALSAVAAVTLSACGGWSLPTCSDELDECNRGGAYTEERTVEAGRKRSYVQPVPEPAPMPAPQPAPAPAPEPAPAPAPVVDDTPVMQSAEPQFTTISK